MKKRITKILGLAVSLALLTSLMVAPLISALTQPTVTLGAYPNTKINEVDADYTIIFTLGKDLEVGDTITITFPVGTTIAAGVPAVTFSTSPGWVAGVWDATPAATATWAGNATARTITGTVAGETIGEASTVRVAITTGITNPSTPGDYTVTVKTSDESTAVTSAAYTVIAPVVTALPGTVYVYNPSGILMSSHAGAGNLGAALNAAGTSFTVKVDPGTYTEDLGVNDFDFNKMTIESTGTAAETILVGDMAIDVDQLTVDGLTIKGEMTITGEKVTITNSVLAKSAKTAAETLITYNNADATPVGTISNSTFDTTLGAVVDSAIVVSQEGLTISGCTFTLDASDIAVATGFGDATYPTTVSTSTVSGTKGIGVKVSGGVTKVKSSTLTGLSIALDIDQGTVTVDKSTISSNGVAISTTDADGTAAIDFDGGTVTITNTTISDSAAYGINVDDAITAFTLKFNTFSGNAKNIYTDENGTLDATFNWWNAATGPVSGSIVGEGSTDKVNTTPHLRVSSAATGGSYTTVAASSLVAKATAGVDVASIVHATTGVAQNAASIIALRYTANPETATPEPALADGFYDAYIGTPALPTDVATIKLYNANVTDTTVVYVWSVLTSKWSAAKTQGVNVPAGYAWFKTGATIWPSITDMSGTPIALTEPATTTTPATPAVIGPAIGAATVSVTPNFTWTPTAGAVSYEFIIAEDLGRTDPFAIIDYSATATINGHVVRDTLKYSTTYFWRVRAVASDGSAGAWATSFFTTMAEPVVAEPPIVVEEVEKVVTPPAPEITIEIPPAAPDEQAIPNWAIVAVIAVAAILVISVVVLIVRTRRIA